MKDIALGYIGLIAPCGMNCGLCIGHLREKKPCSGCHKIDDSNKPQGCRSCVIVNCLLLAETESGFCFDCKKYPCARLKNLDKRYKPKIIPSILKILFILTAHIFSIYALLFGLIILIGFNKKYF